MAEIEKILIKEVPYHIVSHLYESKNIKLNPCYINTSELSKNNNKKVKEKNPPIEKVNETEKI